MLWVPPARSYCCALPMIQFGNPFLSGQHWMPPVEWIGQGYQGFTWPQTELSWHLSFDDRYGLFVTCPLFLLALLAPWGNRRRHLVPMRELAVLMLIPLGLWLFCGGISYTRLNQYRNSLPGPSVSFFVHTAAVMLSRLPHRLPL